MFEDSFMYLMVAERLKEAERIAERARALAPLRRREPLGRRLGRFLVALGGGGPSLREDRRTEPDPAASL